MVNKLGRICISCKVRKSFKEFYRHCYSYKGKKRLTYKSQCKSCHKKTTINWGKKNRDKTIAYQKSFREKNPEKVLAYARTWRKENPEKTKRYWATSWEKHYEKLKASNYQYREKNREKINERRKQFYQDNRDRILKDLKLRLKTDAKFKLNQRISNAIWRTLKTAEENVKARRRWQTLVGYSVEDLKKHLEYHFKEGMSWETYGKYGWHIDHKIPISYFNFEKPEDDEFKQCWALENLQPLWAEENLKKSNSLYFLAKIW